MSCSTFLRPCVGQYTAAPCRTKDSVPTHSRFLPGHAPAECDGGLTEKPQPVEPTKGQPHALVGARVAWLAGAALLEGRRPRPHRADCARLRLHLLIQPLDGGEGDPVGIYRA